MHSGWLHSAVGACWRLFISAGHLSSRRRRAAAGQKAHWQGSGVRGPGKRQRRCLAGRARATAALLPGGWADAADSAWLASSGLGGHHGTVELKDGGGAHAGACESSSTRQAQRLGRGKEVCRVQTALGCSAVCNSYKNRLATHPHTSTRRRSAGPAGLGLCVLAVNSSQASESTSWAHMARRVPAVLSGNCKRNQHAALPPMFATHMVGGSLGGALGGALDALLQFIIAKCTRGHTPSRVEVAAFGWSVAAAPQHTASQRGHAAILQTDPRAHLHLVQQRHRLARAGAADGVAQRNGACSRQGGGRRWLALGLALGIPQVQAACLLHQRMRVHGCRHTGCKLHNQATHARAHCRQTLSFICLCPPPLGLIFSASMPSACTQ